MAQLKIKMAKFQWGVKCLRFGWLKVHMSISNKNYSPTANRKPVPTLKEFKQALNVKSIKEGSCSRTIIFGFYVQFPVQGSHWSWRSPLWRWQPRTWGWWGRGWEGQTLCPGQGRSLGSDTWPDLDNRSYVIHLSSFIN